MRLFTWLFHRAYPTPMGRGPRCDYPMDSLHATGLPPQRVCGHCRYSDSGGSQIIRGKKQ